MQDSEFILRKPSANDGRNAGKGAFGSVCIERDNRTGLVRARKLVTINGNHALRDYITSREEALMLLSLDHPNIVKCLGFAPAEEGVYIWLEKGECSLDDVVDEGIKARGGDPAAWRNYVTRLSPQSGLQAPDVPVDKVELWTAQIFSALYYLHFHRKIYHRDIKPANVVLDAKGNAKLIDFNISVQLGPRDSGYLTVFGGTPAFMSPEATMTAPYTHKCDTYSMAGVIYQLLTSQLFIDFYRYQGARDPIGCFARDPNRHFFALTEEQEARKELFSPSTVPYRDDLGDSFLPALYERLILPEEKRLDSLQACNFIYEFVLERERRRQGRGSEDSPEEITAAATPMTKAILKACYIRRRCPASRVAAVRQNIEEFVRKTAKLSPGDIPDFDSTVKTIETFNQQLSHTISTTSFFVGEPGTPSIYHRPGPQLSPTLQALVDIMNDSHATHLSPGARQYFLGKPHSHLSFGAFPSMSSKTGVEELEMGKDEQLRQLRIMVRGDHEGSPDAPVINIAIHRRFADYLSRIDSDGYNSDPQCVRAETYSTLHFLDDMLGFWLQNDFLEIVIDLAAKGASQVDSSLLFENVEDSSAIYLHCKHAEVEDLLLHDLRYDPLGIEFLDACIRVVSHYANKDLISRILDKLWMFYARHRAYPLLPLSIPATGFVRQLLGKTIFEYSPSLFGLVRGDRGDRGSRGSRLGTPSGASSFPTSPTSPTSVSSVPSVPSFADLVSPSGRPVVMDFSRLSSDDEKQVTKLNERLGIYSQEKSRACSLSSNGLAPRIWLRDGDLIDFAFVYLTVAFFAQLHGIRPVFDFWNHDRLSLTPREKSSRDKQVQEGFSGVIQAGTLTLTAVLDLTCRAPPAEVDRMLTGLPEDRRKEIQRQLSAAWGELRKRNENFARGALPNSRERDVVRVALALGSWGESLGSRDAVSPAWVRDGPTAGLYVIPFAYNKVFGVLARYYDDIEYSPPIQKRFTYSDVLVRPVVK